MVLLALFFCAVTDDQPYVVPHMRVTWARIRRHIRQWDRPGASVRAQKQVKPEEVSSTAAKTDPRQARERLVKRMEREAKKTPAPEGENWLEQYTCLVLTGKITACRKVRTLCAVLLDKLRHPEKYRPWVFDEALANHHIEFVERFCKQPQGKLGAPLRLSCSRKHAGRRSSALSMHTPVCGSIKSA